MADFSSRPGAAFVAGGSGGIGQEICLALARAGSDVFLTYRANREAAERVASEIRALGRQAEIAALQIEEAEAMATVVADAAVKFKHIHSVVYAAGPPIHMQFIGAITPQEWARVMMADVNGCFNLVHATLPHIRGSGGSYVAIITPAVERVPARDILSAAPKAAIEMLMRGLAKEEGRHGVRANAVGPGWIDAGLGRAVMEKELSGEQVDAIRRGLPLRRFGQPADVAKAVVFLLSQDASYITGQSIAVDGGLQL